MSRYVPARHYISFGIVALLLAGFSGLLAWSWPQAVVPAALFALVSTTLLWLAARPAVKTFDSHMEVGKMLVPWQDIRRVDRTGWISPLALKLTFFDDETMLLIYPGEVECCKHLLRTIRQMSTSALIDGIPYRQYWGEIVGPGDSKQMSAPRFRVLRPEDEEEVERLYFLLKTVGHIDETKSGPRNSGDQH
jgi:hypothetical protein